MINPAGVLMIEPVEEASVEPTVNYWTYKTAMVYLATKPSDYCHRGTHQCVCGVRSDDRDHIFPDGRVTNSLAAHYVAWHEGEVPVEEFSKIEEIFSELFPDFDFDAFDANTARQAELLASIPAPPR